MPQYPNWKRGRTKNPESESSNLSWGTMREQLNGTGDCSREVLKMRVIIME